MLREGRSAGSVVAKLICSDSFPMDFLIKPTDFLEIWRILFLKGNKQTNKKKSITKTSVLTVFTEKVIVGVEKEKCRERGKCSDFRFNRLKHWTLHPTSLNATQLNKTELSSEHLLRLPLRFRAPGLNQEFPF